jgi:hypothetical protein
MHKLLLLVAVGLLSTVHQASADCGSGSCAIQQPDTIVLPPTPEDCTSGGCALPTPAPQRLASCTGNDC